MLNKNAATLLEILLAAVVFVTAVAGFYASMSFVRKPAANTGKTLAAATVGSKILDNLRAAVDARDITSGEFSLGTHASSINVDNVIYNYSYTVSCVDPSNCYPGGNSARQVVLNVNY